MNAAIARRALLAGGLASATILLGGGAGAPRRVVSLNPCLDVILVHVADRQQIAALSHYARDGHGSTIAATARTLPFTYGSAEEVIALAPDLVLGSRYSPAATRQALDRLGIRSELFGVPATVAESLAQVRQVAAAVGRAARGERLVGRIVAALRAAAPDAGNPPVSALIFMPGGFASGPGTLMDEMMLRAGLTNAARRYGLTRSMNVPLEQLIADPPELLLSGERSPGAPSWAERIMTHPALERAAGRMHRAVFPERLLFCGGPVLIESANVLAAARQATLARRV